VYQGASVGLVFPVVPSGLNEVSITTGGEVSSVIRPMCAVRVVSESGTSKPHNSQCTVVGVCLGGVPCTGTEP